MKLTIDDPKLWGHIFWHFNLPWFTPDKNWKKNKKKSKLFWVLLLNNNEAFFFTENQKQTMAFYTGLKLLAMYFIILFWGKLLEVLKIRKPFNCKIILFGCNHRAPYSSKFLNNVINNLDMRRSGRWVIFSHRYCFAIRLVFLKKRIHGITVSERKDRWCMGTNNNTFLRKRKELLAFSIHSSFYCQSYLFIHVRSNYVMVQKHIDFM